MSGCVDELHPKDSGGFYGDVTTLCAGFCDVIYVGLVKITSPRNLRVIYGVNRNLARKQGHRICAMNYASAYGVWTKGFKTKKNPLPVLSFALSPFSD